MEWVREWILQIVGVIALGAICDIIMVNGEMKKYVKPILGFVLVFVIIRPISALSTDKIRIDVLQDSIGKTIEITKELDEKQKTDIVKIYEQRLEEKIRECVKVKYNVDSDVFVKVYRDENKFGIIEKVKLEVRLENGGTVNTESIRRYIKEEFGVNIDGIKVAIREMR